MKTNKLLHALLICAALTATVACGKEEPIDPSPEPQPPTIEQKILGLWGLTMVNEQVPNFLSVTTCTWEFTPQNEWIQTMVYNDGVHYDSVADQAVYTFVGEDSVCLIYDNGHTGGFRILECDDSILHTRGWSTQTQNHYTYTLERINPR